MKNNNIIYFILALLLIGSLKCVAQVKSDYGYSIPLNTSHTNNIPFKVMPISSLF